ncbi:MAG TPA: site-specific integrase [Gammaproteobacteria bacterium]|nr:site-specific integrase [Gammaproteobacteria bacterium]
MTPLRQAMIRAMQMRGFSVRTHKSYLAAVTDLARYCRRSPAALEVKDLHGYFEHLAVERKLSASSCRLALNGIRFLYLDVLKREAFDVPIPVPKQPQRIPALLSRTEVARIIAACSDRKYQTMLMLCYGCGLRVSELVSLRVGDIDGERGRLRIEQGKGGKDRLVPLPPTLLARLRDYWRGYRPKLWLFPGRVAGAPLCPTSIQKTYTKAKARAGITKIGGIHALRHAYATHQLEAGLPVHRLQRLLGHQDIRSTLRYVHWVPDYREGSGTHDLIAKLEPGHE